MSDDKQLARFRQAVEEKNEEAARRGPAGDEEPELDERGRSQDVRDPRAKSSGHGKKTADKWNQ